MAREVKLITPLGDEVLRFARMSGSEQIGRLFNYELTAFSTDEEIAVNDILGQNVSVQLEVESGETRFFNGCVSRFAQSGRSTGGFAVYQATLSPWFWFLNCTLDCRIFQMMTVPDIIKQVFNDNGFNNYEDALTGNYTPREYCVQYRESDFNFLSRLMEKEGIYYFFKHEEGKHHLVLADAYSSHSPVKGNATLPYYLPDRSASVEKDHISNWVINARVQPGSVALADYNFKTPQNSLRVNRLIQRNHAQAAFEVFDYPGLYQESGLGEQYALNQIEELQAGFEQVTAKTDVRHMAAGGVFTLSEHPRSDQNREYLVVGTQHTLEVNEYASGDANAALTYNCDFSAIPSQTPFRSQSLTHKPKVYGPHTAVVVGPAGEEIYPDEYGRVKVQFHWDRYGGADENSSCWVRVSQGWAGAGWGMMQLPRIGQEVIVDFAEGDPDRPIVTGRLYNADNMPPYALPANKTQSGIKSRSSPGGGAGNFNEIRMEDKIGNEELYIQAEKDENILVKNNKTENVGVDETTSIGNNQSLTVGNDQTETIGNDQTESIGNNHSESIGNNQTISVGNDQTESIGNNRTESVGSNETLSVGADRTRNVGSNESITVGSNRMHTVAINETIAVGAAQEIAVGGLQVIAVGAAQTITVGAAQSIGVGINQSIDVGVNQSIDVGSNRKVSVGANNTTNVSDNDTLKVGKNVVIDAGDAITLKCGQASIAMKKDGTIVIEGKNITIKGSGKMDITASKNIKMKGKKILQN